MFFTCCSVLFVFFVVLVFSLGWQGPEFEGQLPVWCIPLFYLFSFPARDVSLLFLLLSCPCVLRCLGFVVGRLVPLLILDHAALWGTQTVPYPIIIICNNNNPRVKCRLLFFSCLALLMLSFFSLPVFQFSFSQFSQFFFFFRKRELLGEWNIINPHLDIHQVSNVHGSSKIREYMTRRLWNSCVKLDKRLG